MSNLKVKDGDSVDFYLKGTGAGSALDPFISDPGLVQPLTDAELRASPIIVSGTFYPATQPVSIATMPSTPVTGTFYQATQPVSMADLLMPDKFKTLKAATITTIATVWTPASGKKIRLMGGSISVSATVSVLFEDNSAGTDVWQTPKLTADTPYNFDLGNGVLLSAINNVLKATSSAAATITGTLYGIEE